MENGASLYEKERCLSELRVVLLGGRCAGKSSAGNTILGREEFESGIRTAKSERRQGKAGGRQVTVVDTPGWWCDVSACDTPELVKQEIVCGVSLCPPGPHALLLVLKVSSSFTEKRRRSVEEHLELLSERVWRHTVLLFTNGDWLGDSKIEQHIETEGRALQWLVERCGNRYHVLNNHLQPGGAQITQLLTKIDEMLTENSGRPYETEPKMFQDIEDRRRAVQEGVKQRLMEVQKQRSLLTGGVWRLSELRIVLLGARRSGKSSAGNVILGRRGLETGSRTAECVSCQGPVAGRRVTVIDTPGWWMNYFAGESAEFDKQEISRSVSLCPPGAHVVLLVIRVDRSFSETYRRAVEEHLELLGGRVWGHTLILFTFGDWLDGSIEHHIESEGDALRWLVGKCGNRYHVFNKNSTNGSQVRELLEKVEVTVAGNGGLHYESTSGILQEVEERRMRARERWMKLQEQRETLRSLLTGDTSFLPDLRIVLLGGRNTGKSSAGNTILGREEFEAGHATMCFTRKQGRVQGRTVTVVDTPGWQTSSSDRQRVVGQEVADVESLCSPRPHAFLLVVNVSSSFTERHRRAAEDYLGHLGKQVWSSTMVLFTNGDWLGGRGTSAEQHIESEGAALLGLLEKCGNRYYIFNNKGKRDGSQVTELLQKIQEMEAGRRRQEQDQTAEVEKSTNQLQEQQLRKELEEDSALPDRHFISLPHGETEGSSSGETLSPNLPVNPSLADGMLELHPAAGKSEAENLLLSAQDGTFQASALEPVVRGTQGLSLVQTQDWFCPNVSLHNVGQNVWPPITLSSSKPHTLLLVTPADHSKVIPWRVLESTGEISGRGTVGNIGALCSCSQRPVGGFVQLSSRATQSPFEMWAGNSTIEELESFIDSYFDMVRDDARGLVHKAAAPQGGNCPVNDLLHSSHSPPKEDTATARAWRISPLMDNRLSRLDNLEAMEREIMEMKQRLKDISQTIQDLKSNGRETIQDLKSNGEETIQDPKSNGEETIQDLKSNGEETIQDLKSNGREREKLSLKLMEQEDNQ